MSWWRRAFGVEIDYSMWRRWPVTVKEASTAQPGELQLSRFAIYTHQMHGIRRRSSSQAFVFSTMTRLASPFSSTGKPLSMAAITVVFDFDMTIIDCDSDNWVVEEMGVSDVFNQLRLTLPWNSLMDRIMSEVHARGKTIKEIADCFKRVPLHHQMITAIKAAYALGCDLRIVSDANAFFIETILKHHGVFEFFSEINTNPAFVDESGKLRILSYHDFKSSLHGCSLCPPNMCKGLIIERIRASVSVDQKKRFIYLGDGRGDFCPSTKLGEGDRVMPRKNFPLWDLISSNPMLVKAKVHEWSNAEEVERILSHLIKTMSDEDSSTHMLSVECKFETIPIPSHEALPQVLPIPH